MNRQIKYRTEREDLNFILYVFLILALSCKKPEIIIRNSLEQSLTYAGNNRAELEKVIAYFSKNTEDSLRLKSALFLIDQMKHNVHYGGRGLEVYEPLFSRAAGMDEERIGKWIDSLKQKTPAGELEDIKIKQDLQHLRADYLIKNIEQAHLAWESAPWKDAVSYNAFCNFILPYKSFSEYPEKWRSWLQEKYAGILETRKVPKTMEDYCCAFVEEERSWFRYSEVFFNLPSTLSIRNIFKVKQGACVEMANLAAYTSRAWGIPVAIDFTPQWANHTAGHAWNALITSDTSFISFLGAEGTPGDFTGISTGETKSAKIYRHLQVEVESAFAKKARKAGFAEIPINLKNSRILDVTHLYVPTADCNLSIRGRNGTPVYLCVFQNGQWNAIAGGFIGENQVIIENMGRDILYMPMFYKNNGYQSAAPPVLIDHEGGQKQVVMDEKSKQSMRLERKYPLKKFRTKWTYAQYLVNARFEASDSPDFRKVTLLYTAPDPFTWFGTNTINGKPARDRLQYESLWEHTELSPVKSYRYIRMVAAEGDAFKLGELKFYTPGNSLPLKGKAIGSVSNPDWAFDGIPGYSIIKEDELYSERWVGLDLGKSMPISQIHYLPANDKNQIHPGNSYELFYWKDKWISHGIQKATGHFVDFVKVPAGGIYWLHCLDCTTTLTEERPFTYENEKQVWW